MLDKQNWIFLLINTIITVAVLVIMFKFQETKIKTIMRRIEKKMNRCDDSESRDTSHITNDADGENGENEENGKDGKDKRNDGDDTDDSGERFERKNNRNIKNADIDSFIDPLE